MKHFFIILIFTFCLNKIVNSTSLVSHDWVNKNACKDNVVLIEVGKSKNSYEVEHINCSLYTNYYKNGWRESIKNRTMVLPLASKLKEIVENLGINNSDHVVLYPKKNDVFSMAETTSIYFTFKYLGHNKISIINGSFKKLKKNYPFLVEEGIGKFRKKSNYTVILNDSILAKEEDIKKNISKNKVIIDSREKDFFLGINKLSDFDKFGTIEKSINIPSKWNLKSRDLEFNSMEKLTKIFNYANINGEVEDPIFFCYAGLESSLNWFVSSELLGHKNSKLYEGSIFDWHLNKNSLIVNDNFKNK